MRYKVSIACRRLRQVRLDKGVGQLAIAQETRIHPSLLSNYEQGWIVISPAHVLRLCRYFETDYEALFPEHPDRVDIACKTLTRLREARDLNQRQLARLTTPLLPKPIRYQALNAYECGRWLARPYHILALANVLGERFENVFPEIVF